MNSVRNRPTPSAPASSTSGMSCGSSMLANSSIGVPSTVVAGVDLRRRRRLRSALSSACSARYSASTIGSGSTISRPRVPSTISVSPSLIIWRAWCRPTIAGMPSERATIAVCEVTPPTSVTKPPKWCFLNRIMSAGERSCATTISFSSSDSAGSTSVWPPISAASTRSTACCTSALRSRRYGSSISSKRSTRRSISCTSAHSALARRLRISSRGACASAESLRIMRCRSRKASNSAGEPAGMWALSAASPSCAVFIARSKRATSASTASGATS